MQVDALAVRLRPRTAMEAADLGVRLCQSAVRSVYACYAVVFVPVTALALATLEIAPWLPPLILWCAKPWLDRTILFVLSRAAFAQRSTLGDLWRAQRQVWWGQLLLTWTLRRLSPWRALTQPVYQLEGLSFGSYRKRVRQIRGRATGAALLLTSAFSLAEAALWFALSSLAVWLAPPGQGQGFAGLFAASDWDALVGSVLYAMVIAFLEPYYVASGFAMYLNRRAELEAWDIEQEFRRAFAH